MYFRKITRSSSSAIDVKANKVLFDLNSCITPTINQNFLIQTIDNNDVLRPLTDGFDIGTINRQSQDSDNDIADDIDPGNCDDLGLSTTYEKVLDFTYDKGSKEEIGKHNQSI